jgi:hypothetical protein
MSPVVLDTFHVPLIYDDNNFLSFAFINLFEQIIISLINENAFEFGEEDIHALNVPVKQVLINTFLCELSWFGALCSVDDFFSFRSPE